MKTHNPPNNYYTMAGRTGEGPGRKNGLFSLIQCTETADRENAKNFLIPACKQCMIDI
jgi:hypothetical protein